MKQEMLGDVLKYGYLTPRIRGKKSFLLVKGDYDAMLSAESPTAALRRLEGTRYKPYISQLVLEEFNLSKVEKALVESYQDDVAFVSKSLKEHTAAEFFAEYGRSLELKALLGVLKAIILGIPWEEASTYIFPYGRISYDLCQSLVETKNLKRVLELLKEKHLIRQIEEALSEVEDPIRRSIIAESFITKHILSRLWEKANELTGRNKLCIRLLGVQIDTTNMMTILRMKKLGFTAEEISESLAPVSFKLSDREMASALQAATEKDSMKVFTGGFYASTVSPLISVYEVREDLPIFEVAFKRLHASECERAFYQPFYLGEALAYVYLKYYEVKDIIAILTAKYMKLPADKVEPNLILHQPPYPI